MKIFIQKILIWFILITTIYYIIGYFPFVIFDKSYPIYKSQLEFIDKDSADIIFIGDSRLISSVIPERISNSRNLGVVGSSPIDGYFLLKRYLRNNGKVKTVFLSYAWDRLGNKYYPEVIIHRGVPLGLYAYNEYTEVLNNSNLIDKKFSQSISLKEFFMTKTHSPIFIGGHLATFSLSNYQNNMLLYKTVNSQKGYVSSIWGKNRECVNCKGYEAYMDSFHLKPIYDFYFQELIKLCVSNNIKLIFETIPLNESSKIKEDVKIGYQEYLKKIALLYPTQTLSDTVFYYNDTYFEDPHHMNPKGAKKYTEYLKLKYFKHQ